ncbi:DMT family transporter [Sneathiella sp. CAU 1612]|uniref:DMT family transporter n=1 Tax=Sneathiella sedimenti TaxID=2816034 RepID=A0ABS3F6F6_9PROT|nr:DMT family transporter [Sneathiella sedimenti]MBO0334110.1 DMT family transporter [Sneathiella sedimenti]
MSNDSVDSKSSGIKSGDLFLIGAVLAWGINFPIAKYALDFMDPITFSATRYLAASLLLFGILLFKNAAIRISVKEAGMLVIIGLLSVALFQGGWAYGLSLTSASKASVLITTSPIFGALIAATMGNRPSTKAWIGILLSFLGVAVVINNSLTEITFSAGTIVGDMLIVGASMMWALYTYVSGPLVAKRGPLLVTAWATLFGSIILNLIGSPNLIEQNWAGISTLGWLSWASTAIFGAALAFVWYCAGIARLGITKGMVYSFFIPVVAILSSVILLDEVITIIQIFGAAIVLLGVKLTRSD